MVLLVSDRLHAFGRQKTARIAGITPIVLTVAAPVAKQPPDPPSAATPAELPQHARTPGSAQTPVRCPPLSTTLSQHAAAPA
jgi:hypothetical protein